MVWYGISIYRKSGQSALLCALGPQSSDGNAAMDPAPDEGSAAAEAAQQLVDVLLPMDATPTLAAHVAPASPCPISALEPKVPLGPSCATSTSSPPSEVTVALKPPAVTTKNLVEGCPCVVSCGGGEQEAARRGAGGAGSGRGSVSRCRAVA